LEIDISDEKDCQMLNELRPPIILFGNTRSGTSIVQKVISSHRDVMPWYEPNELWVYADPGRIHDEFDVSDATYRVRQYIRKRFLKYQRLNENRRIMEKTPKNILRIPYVQEILPEATFLFIVRNPFSFISSVEYKYQRTVTRRGILRRLKHTPFSQLHHWVGLFFEQQLNKRVLRKKYLKIWGPRYRGIQDDLKTHNLLTVIARQWSICSIKAEKDMALFENKKILRLKYEDFVDDPMPDLRRICAHCGLDMTSNMVETAKKIVTSDRVLKWKRLDPRDLAKVFPEVSGEMQRHGYEIPAELVRYIEDANSDREVGPCDMLDNSRPMLHLSPIRN
jgi:hypothetical protein